MILRLTIFFISLFPTLAFACSITPTTDTFKDVVESADVIFYGKPISIGKRYTEELASKDAKQISDSYFSAFYEVIFEAEKIWKGPAGKNLYLLDNDGPCSQHLRTKLEQPMLIFAQFDDDGLKIMKIGSTRFNKLNETEKIKKLGKAVWEGS